MNPNNPTDISQLKAKLSKLILELNLKYVEREELVIGFIIAYLTKRLVFAGGPPGTGKTALSKEIAKTMGGTSLYKLVSKTTTVDELIGPLDFKALDQGNFERKLDRGLADVELGILDEGFKGNSETLNSILGLMLDRTYTNGNKEINCPLNTLIICSNELPEDESLNAFWDRLDLRYWVENVSAKNKIKLMQREVNNSVPKISVRFTKAELDLLRAEIKQVKISQKILSKFVEITQEVEGKTGAIASTRKHNQLIYLFQCHAFLHNKTEVDEDDFILFEHILWNQVEDVVEIKLILEKFAVPEKAEINKIITQAKKAFSQVKPFTGASERPIWSQGIAKKEIELNELERDLKDLTNVYLDLESTPLYLQALTKFKEMKNQIQDYNTKAYSAEVSTMGTPRAQT